MKFKQFNTLRSYLLSDITIGGLSDIAKYGYANTGYGELIYTDNAAKAALHFSDDIEMIYNLYLEELPNTYDLTEIAVNMLYTAIEVTCYDFDRALNDALSDLEKEIEDAGRDHHFYDELRDYIYDSYIENISADDLEKEIYEIGKDFLDNELYGPLNNNLHLRLIGCGGQDLKLEADSAYELAEKYADFVNDFPGAYRFQYGTINGKEMKDLEDINDYY